MPSFLIAAILSHICWILIFSISLPFLRLLCCFGFYTLRSELIKNVAITHVPSDRELLFEFRINLIDFLWHKSKDSLFDNILFLDGICFGIFILLLSSHLSSIICLLLILFILFVIFSLKVLFPIFKLPDGTFSRLSLKLLNVIKYS